SPRGSRAHRALPPFPTRRSSDLERLFQGRPPCAPRLVHERIFADEEQVEGDQGRRRAVAVTPHLRDVLHVHPALQTLEALDPSRSEEHTSELQSRENLVCRLLLE